MSDSGFDCEFLEEPPQAIQSECPVCLHILRDPYQVTCCGYSYCLTCIQRVKDDEKPCPVCNQEGFDDFPNKGLKRSLYQFRVHCNNKKNGCLWSGELGQIDQHLNINPEPNNLFHGCEYTETECSYCPEKMLRQYLQVHQNDRCGKRPVICKYCSEYKSEFDDVVGNHWSVCPRYTLKCPNDCGAFPERQNMEDHVNKDCPRTEINCDFLNVGCGVKFARDHMSSHLEDAMSIHLSLIAASHSMLTLSHANLSTSVTQLQAENHTLREQLHENQESLSQEMADMKQTEIQCQAMIKELQEGLSVEQQTNRERTEQQRQELEELRQKQKNELDNIQQQITELREKQDNEKRERDNKSSEQDRIIHTLQTSLHVVSSEHEQLSQWINTPTLPFEFTMSNYIQHQNNCWYSPVFYTSIHGYKMCLGVDANGSGTGRGTHVSVYVRMMHGEYDDFLWWPFHGDMTIQLLNQIGSEAHHTVVVHFNQQTEHKFSGRVTRGERSEHGWGSPTFIAHKELQSKSVRVGYTFVNREYLKNDCLKFRIAI